jgi:hypothetical protein
MKYSQANKFRAGINNLFLSFRLDRSYLKQRPYIFVDLKQKLFCKLHGRLRRIEEADEVSTD